MLQANLRKIGPKNPLKDDLPIDDEDAEGSGFEESRYDLESSGSGYGPDDEDTDHEREPFSKLLKFVDTTLIIQLKLASVSSRISKILLNP